MNPDSTPEEPEKAPDPAPDPAPRRRRRARWVVVALVILLGVLYSRGWSTQPLTLSDGRSFEVLNFDRHISYLVDRDGSRTTEHSFYVRYYSDAEGMDAMGAEARDLAPSLFPIAERLGYSILKLQAARPLLFRHFPLVIFSTNLRFVRDSAGAWREERP
jgi:hypothetical protein